MVTSSTVARLWEVRFHHAWSPPGSAFLAITYIHRMDKPVSSGARGTAQTQETEGVLLCDTCLYVHVFQGCWRQFMEAQMSVTPNLGWASPEIRLPVTTTKGPAWRSAAFRVAASSSGWMGLLLVLPFLPFQSAGASLSLPFLPLHGVSLVPPSEDASSASVEQNLGSVHAPLNTQASFSFLPPARWVTQRSDQLREWKESWWKALLSIGR